MMKVCAQNKYKSIVMFLSQKMGSRNLLWLLGRKARFADKEIKADFNMDFDQALPVILNDLLEVKEKVLIVSDNLIDVDPQLLLAKKQISVCYMSSRDILTPFWEKIDRLKFA